MTETTIPQTRSKMAHALCASLNPSADCPCLCKMHGDRVCGLRLQQVDLVMSWIAAVRREAIGETPRDCRPDSSPDASPPIWIGGVEIPLEDHADFAGVLRQEAGLIRKMLAISLSLQNNAKQRQAWALRAERYDEMARGIEGS